VALATENRGRRMLLRNLPVWASQRRKAPVGKRTSRSELLREMAEREKASQAVAARSAHAPCQPVWSPSARSCVCSAWWAYHIAFSISSSVLPRSPVSIIGRGVP
jgi:hypothetical protein